MSYRTWYDPPRKGDEEPFPGSPDDMMNTTAALRARVAKLEAALTKISTAARKDTSLVPLDPLLAFIVGVVDATLPPNPDAEKEEKR